jgi:hypothetical protein
LPSQMAQANAILAPINKTPPRQLSTRCHRSCTLNFCASTCLGLTCKKFYAIHGSCHPKTDIRVYSFDRRQRMIWCHWSRRDCFAISPHSVMAAQICKWREGTLLASLSTSEFNSKSSSKLRGGILLLYLGFFRITIRLRSAWQMTERMACSSSSMGPNRAK